MWLGEYIVLRIQQFLVQILMIVLLSHVYTPPIVRIYSKTLVVFVNLVGKGKRAMTVRLSFTKLSPVFYKLTLSFPWVSVLFLNSWRVSVVPYYVTTHPPPAIQKQHWHSREAQIEPPLFECEWTSRVQAYVCLIQNDRIFYYLLFCYVFLAKSNK
jgi:hypothetical protein